MAKSGQPDRGHGSPVPGYRVIVALSLNAVGLEMPYRDSII